MKKTRFHIAIILAFCPLLFLKGQDRVIVDVYPNKSIVLEYEKFDLDAFSSKFALSGSLDYSYNLSDGTNIRVTCQRRGETIEVYETPPAPVAYRIFKEFYADGNMKKKGLYLPQQFPVGKWLECDWSGKCYIVDQDANKGDLGYNGLLRILDERGFIGKGWTFVVWYSEYKHQWGVKLRNGDLYKVLDIDANSGEVRTQ